MGTMTSMGKGGGGGLRRGVGGTCGRPTLFNRHLPRVNGAQNLKKKWEGMTMQLGGRR